MARFVSLLFFSFFSISTKYIVRFANNSMSQKTEEDFVNLVNKCSSINELREKLKDEAYVLKWTQRTLSKDTHIIITPEKPLAKINGALVLTQSGKLLNLNNFNDQNIYSIRADTKAISPELILEFIRASGNEILDEYEVNILNKNSIELKDIKNENIIIKCSHKNQKLHELIEKAKRIVHDKLSSMDNKKRASKITADLRFKGQIIIYY